MSLTRWVAVLLALLPSTAVVAQDSGDEVALGQALFQDKNLSADRTVACASCHRPDHAFSDDRPVSAGVGRQNGARNAPSLLGVSQYSAFLWDGHAATLEDQARFPLLATNELGFRNEDEVVARVAENPDYVAAFRHLRHAGGGKLAFSDITRVLVVYERSLSAPTPLDRFLAGDREALSTAARRGLNVFRDQAGCAACHALGTDAAPLTDNQFHLTGVGLHALGSRLGQIAATAARMDASDRFRRVESDPELAALGHYLVTLDPKDIGKFRTPSLRNVARTAPYMHDGSVASLEQAIDIELYYQGLERGGPVILSTDEKRDLLAFLQSLSTPEIAIPKAANRAQAN